MSPATAPAARFDLSTSYRAHALGIPAARGVMLSWKLSGDAVIDRARGVDVVVASTPECAPASTTWTATGVTSSSVRYEGAPLESRAVRYWRATAWDVDGAPLVSDVARFEIGLESASDWSAEWVSAPVLDYRRQTWDPAPIIRRRFELDVVPTDARAYITALGIYRVWVNGVELTADSLFRPGWTDYRFRVLHQTWDLSSFLVAGPNVVAVELAKGWYGGWLGLQREPALYGEQPALRVQVEADGDVIVESDERWLYSYGDIVATDMLVGESQDLRQAQPGWTTADFDDSAWSTLARRDDIDIPITPQPHDPVAAYREYEGVLVRATRAAPRCSTSARTSSAGLASPRAPSRRPTS